MICMVGAACKPGTSPKPAAHTSARARKAPRLALVRYGMDAIIDLPRPPSFPDQAHGFSNHGRAFAVLRLEAEHVHVQPRAREASGHIVPGPRPAPLPRAARSARPYETVHDVSRHVEHLQGDP